jgi:hypothetical protein
MKARVSKEIFNSFLDPIFLHCLINNFKKIFFGSSMFFCVVTYAQNGYIVLMKKQKPVQYYWKDAHFTFQTKDRQWITGIITGILNDSFYFTQEIIRYNTLGSDTLHFGGLLFSLADVYALPTKKEEIVYDHDQVHVILGHEKFVWVRNGFIFQVLGAGYVGLSVANDLASNEPPFAKTNLSGIFIGSALFVIGIAMHFTFDPYIHPGKKYQLKTVSIHPAKGH